MAKKQIKEPGQEIRGWVLPDLKGKIAVVAGASRGAGRGIALALGDAGATVYVAGRTSRNGPKPSDGAPGTIEDTAEEVTQRGGNGIPVRADMTNEEDVAALFDRVRKDHGRLNLLVNALFGVGDLYSPSDYGGNIWAMWNRPFWEMPLKVWNATMQAGPFAFLAASHHAAKMMVAQRSGLIVHISEPTGEGNFGKQVFWGLVMIAHAAMNHLTVSMAHELKTHGVAVVGLWPGFMRTERVMMVLKSDTKSAKQYGLDRSESTEYVGRAIACLAADSNVMASSGKSLVSGDLARKYGFRDVDGKYVPNFFKSEYFKSQSKKS